MQMRDRVNVCLRHFPYPIQLILGELSLMGTAEKDRDQALAHAQICPGATI